MRIALGCLFLLFSRLAFANPAADTVVVDNDSSFDVHYVKLTLSVRPDTESLAGSAELLARANALRPDRTVQLSLTPMLSVDSVFVDGLAAVYDHLGDKLFVTLNHNYAPQQPFDVVIFYHGYSDRGGYIHATQTWPHPGIPYSSTTSEPYKAKDWWPCKDNPADKLDSADLVLTCPKPNSIGSNGILLRTVDRDSTTTFYWHESYPIDHYLIAFVCTIFDTIGYWHHWADGDSMRILDYVFPNSIDTMPRSLVLIDTLLDVYSKWFGPYAFKKEKYGFLQWLGGGMENETLSFCYDADTNLVAHETAHQWFGDAVTCKTWNDCWLNEGFATYTADLFQKYSHYSLPFDSVVKITENFVTSNPGGSVYTPDSALPYDAFDGRRVYGKGAMVLHMLNFVLGSDSAYFRCLREYVSGPLRYGVASTEDLRASIERSMGRDMKWFFDEWIYGDGYPIYDVAWNNSESLHPSVAISQSGSSPTSPLFIMPIELEFIGPDIDTTVEVWDDALLKPFAFSFERPVNRMVFDPHNWLLDGSLPKVLDVKPASISQHSDLLVAKTMQTYAISFSLASAGETSIEISDILGRPIATLSEGILAEGLHSISWRPVNLPQGVYFCRLIEDGNTIGIEHFTGAY